VAAANGLAALTGYVVSMSARQDKQVGYYRFLLRRTSMKLKVAFIIAAIYMGLIGIGHLAAPIAMSAGVIPADAPAGMAAFIRHYSGLFLSLAVLNWLARNAEDSTARKAIVAANLVAFILAAILDIFAVITGAGMAGLAPASTNLLIAALIFWASR